MKMSTTITRKSELYYKVLTLINISKGDIFSFTDNEKKVLSLMFEKRDELYREGLSLESIDKVLFAADVKKQFMDELNISYNSFHNIISSLRSKRMIVKDSLNPFYESMRLLDIESDSFEFTLIIKKG